MKKRYRLEFEILGPFSDTWRRAYRESCSLAELQEQKKGQVGADGVRNAVILEQTVSEWSPVEGGKLGQGGSEMTEADSTRSIQNLLERERRYVARRCAEKLAAQAEDALPNAAKELKEAARSIREEFAP